MLAYAFLRLTTLEALRPSALLAANGPWPTLAGAYVSDSRIDPIDDQMASDERRALIGVYTEESTRTKIAQSGPQFYKADVDLVFELSVAQRFDVDGDVIIDYADTDAAAATMLDVLEEQISFALHYGPSGALFRQMAKLPFEVWESKIKYRAGEEGARIAARTVRARICVKEGCHNPAPSSVPVDFDRLPSGLKAIAEQLGESTYLHDLAIGMARMAPVMPSRVDLKSVGITAAPQPGDASTAPVQGVADNLQG